MRPGPVLRVEVETKVYLAAACRDAERFQAVALDARGVGGCLQVLHRTASEGEGLTLTSVRRYRHFHWSRCEHTGMQSIASSVGKAVDTPAGVGPGLRWHQHSAAPAGPPSSSPRCTRAVHPTLSPEPTNPRSPVSSPTSARSSMRSTGTVDYSR